MEEWHGIPDRLNTICKGFADIKGYGVFKKRSVLRS